jgi:hypothetical protein
MQRDPRPPTSKEVEFLKARLSHPEPSRVASRCVVGALLDRSFAPYLTLFLSVVAIGSHDALCALGRGRRVGTSALT